MLNFNYVVVDSLTKTQKILKLIVNLTYVQTHGL